MSSTNSLEDLSKENEAPAPGALGAASRLKARGGSLGFVSSDSRSAGRGAAPRET